MVYCDNSPAVIGWNSEEVVVPYISPVDNRWHRYFVDFLVVYKLPDGSRKTVLIEVKPLIQTKEPERKAGSKKTPKRFLKEVMTWGVNQAKWKAATEYAEERKWEFRLMTEKELT
jgi:hypothetical protein